MIAFIVWYTYGTESIATVEEAYTESEAVEIVKKRGNGCKIIAVEKAEERTV